MALTVYRNFGRVLTRSFSVTSSKLLEKYFPDPMEHATGLEKKELMALQAGNDDPFQMKTQVRGIGSKDQPNLVSSVEDSKFIGCVCEEDSTIINWLWVHKDDPKRCECGYWFKLVPGKSL